MPDKNTRSSVRLAPAGSAPPEGAGGALIEKIGLASLLLAVFLAPIIGGLPAGGVYGGDTALSALRILVIVAALCLWGNIAQAVRQPASIAAGALAGLSVLSLLVHSHLLTSPVLLYAMLPATLDILAYALAFTLCLGLARRDSRTVRYIVWALAAAAAWVAVSSALEYGQFKSGGQPLHRAQGTFFSPNFTAGLLGLCLPVVVVAFLEAEGLLPVVGFGAVGALVFGALVATGSRAGVAMALAGLVVGLVAALVARALPGNRVPWARVGGLVVACALLGFAFLAPLRGRVTGGGSDAAAAVSVTASGDASGGGDHSGEFRKWTWKGSLAMAKANPVLGTGPGTFPIRYPAFSLVGKTDLAHESYLQVAAEEGVPALLAVLATLGLTVIGGVTGLLRKAPEGEPKANPLPRLLWCGLLGGLVVGILRNLYDSEWSLLGNGLPFWAVAGLVAALAPARSATTAEKPTPPALTLAARVGLGIALVLALVSFHAAQTVDGVMAQMQAGKLPADIPDVWPPSPDLLGLRRDYAQAALVEPSGKRFYQMGRREDEQGNPKAAVAAFQKAEQADPNALQTLRALAEQQEKAGDRPGALATWQRLIARHEGPEGQIRAIPELPETYPFFAYVALAKDAAAHGDTTAANTYRDKAARIVEDYAHTPPLYQQVELSMTDPQTVLARRDDLRARYTTLMDDWAASDKPRATDLAARKTATLALLDKFAKPAATTPSGGG